MSPEEQRFEVETQDLGNNQTKMSVSIPVEQVNQELNQSYQRLSKRAKIKGFRPGKIPRQVLEGYFKDQAEADAVQKIVEAAYPAALKEKGLTPSSRPKIEPETLEKDKPFVFHASFEVLPEITAKNYTKIRVKRPVYEVKGEDVQENLERLRKTHMQLKAVEENRPVREGDFAQVDYAVAISGEGKEQSKQNVSIEVGGGRFFPEVEDALVGMKRGEEKTVPISFPPDHAQKGLAGKEMTFRIALKEIKEPELPGLDDAFAREVSSYTTLAELTNAVREGLEKDAKEREERDLKSRILEAVRDRNPIELPPGTVNERASFLLSLMQQDLGSRGLGLNLEGEEGRKIWERVRSEAENEIRNELLIDSIARQEKIEPNEQEVNERLAVIESRYSAQKGKGKGAEPFERERYQRQIRNDLTRESVIAFLSGNAKIEV